MTMEQPAGGIPCGVRPLDAGVLRGKRGRRHAGHAHRRWDSLPMANCVGLIDQDYCGPNDELLISLYNIGTEPYTVEKYERVAQGMFVPIRKASFEEVDELTGANRGGFGSTG